MRSFINGIGLVGVVQAFVGVILWSNDGGGGVLAAGCVTLFIATLGQLIIHSED